jgi:CRP-like cAMP-binding protein
MNTNMHGSTNSGRTYPYSVVQGGLKRTAEPASPRQNQLIASLPESVMARLSAHLERVEMAVGDVIYQYGSQSQHVWFPATAIVSLIYDMEDGASAEVAMVGNEGMIGVGLFMAGETMPGLATVQCAGHAYRLSARVLKEEFDRSSELQHTLLCYTQALIVEIAQNAVCNRHHPISKQLCRCLLLAMDRSTGNEMALTHEMIANSLGVRRECVTVAAGKLRAEGLIDYKRGHITVLDREGLEAHSCECYGVVKKTFDRLLPVRCEEGEEGDDSRFTGHGHYHPGRNGVRNGYLRAMR